MRVYIASDNQEPGVRLAQALEAAGHEISSSWLRDPAFGTGRSAAERTCVADQELAEVAGSDAIVHLASADNVPGGKHVEFGYALGLGILCVHVGRPENIFHYHPRVVRVDDAAGAVAALRRSGSVVSDC